MTVFFFLELYGKHKRSNILIKNTPKIVANSQKYRTFAEQYVTKSRKSNEQIDKTRWI